MKDLRIVFMGTPDFAVTILKKLVMQKLNIVGVITAPDKPAGRGRKLNESAVKKYALSENLNILQPKNLKDKTFQEELRSLNANLQIVVAFRMLPKVVWQMPKYGTFNLHASLLPAYRGAAPIHWAIINGEEKTGVTTFFIDDKIDTGEIILKEEININKNETVGSLHDKLMNLGADLVLKTVEQIANNNVTTTKQPELEEKAAPKLNSDNTKINWNDSLKNIYNTIRGLNPFPTAWSKMQNGDEHISVKIYDVEKIEENHNLSIGTIITSKKEIKVAVKNGFINIISLKIAGKKKMVAKSLLNGFTILENSKML
jgi:methionyl-tRNA formyltransferase